MFRIRCGGLYSCMERMSVYGWNVDGYVAKSVMRGLKLVVIGLVSLPFLM